MDFFDDDFRRRMMMGLPPVAPGPDFTGAIQPTAAPPVPSFMPQVPQTPRQAFNAGGQMSKGGTLAGAEAEAAKADMLAHGAQQASADLIARQKADEERTAAGQERLAAARADLDAKQQEVADTKIERGKVFKDMPVEGKLAVAVQAFVTGMADLKSGHGAEKAMAIVNKIIADDVQDQMVNLENKRASVAAKTSMHQMDTAETYRAADLRTAATLRGYDAAIKEFQAVAASADSDIIRAAAEKGAGDIMAQRAQVLEGWDFQNKQFENQKENQRRQLGVSYGNLKLQRDEFEYRKGRDQETDALKLDLARMKGGRAAGGPEPPPGLTPKEARELAVHGADGRLIGYARSTAAAEKASDRVEQYEDFRRDLVSYQAMLKEHGREFSGVAGYGKSKEFAALQSLHTRILMTAKEKAKLGVLSGKDQELIERQLPPPRSLLGGTDPLPGVQNTLKQLDGSMDRFMRINVPGADRYSPPSFEDFGGTNKAVTPGEGRTANSMPSYLRPGYVDPLPPLPPSVTGVANPYAPNVNDYND